MPLPKEAIEQHIQEGGSWCPYCRSGNIRADEEGAFEGNQYEQVIRCEDCNKRWRDIFTLTGIEEME